MRRRKLWGDISTAILALVLAVIVWVNATYQSDRPREDFFPKPIPIEVLNAPSGLVVTNNPPNSVRVKLKAFASSWQTLTVNDFRAVADWSGLTEGTHAVPVKVTCFDRTVSIISVHPDTIYVRLERLERKLKEVAVELKDREEVPLGYRVNAPEVDPDLVAVEGPASAVEKVAKLKVSLSLANQRAPFERVLTPVPVDEFGYPVTGVTLSPQTVTVKVNIEKKHNYREVVVRARTKGQPARGYFVSGVSVVPSTVTVIGPPSVIDKMGGLVDTKEEIDITGATRMVAQRVPLDLPEGVFVLGAQEGEPFEVLVTVDIAPVMGGTTVELPIKVRRLRKGLVADL
ncbi:MAG: hypothetical protein J7M05_05540, partial [Anaerolineae bacterium]|nr:hypothetical protein [Anaerolineae bacterium]